MIKPVTITTTSLVDGQVARFYSVALKALGGTTPYQWTVVAGTLPAGLRLTTGGTLSGTPSAAGTSTFTVQLRDAKGRTATQELTLVINPRP